MSPLLASCSSLCPSFSGVSCRDRLICIRFRVIRGLGFISVFLVFLVFGLVTAKDNSVSDDERSIVFKPLLRYETSEKIVEIGRPRFMDMDDKENLYVLDVITRHVHIWDSRGKYLRSFGGKGEGPGELMLVNQEGDLLISHGKIMVVDETIAKVHFFNLETLAFEKSISRPSKLARFYLFAIDDVLYALNISGSRMTQEVVRVNMDLEVEAVIFSRPYDKHEWLADRKYIFRPYANTIVVGAGRTRVFLGETQDNLIRIFGTNGEIESFRVPLVQDDISEEEKQSYQSQLVRSGRQDESRLEFPAKGHFFNHILPLADVVLVMRVMAGSTKVKGLACNYLFEPVGSFNTSLGDLVFINNVGDNLLTISVGEGGEYQITSYMVQRQ